VRLSQCQCFLETVAEPSRKDGIAQNLYWPKSKDFLEAGTIDKFVRLSAARCAPVLTPI
jgi:hypothetical protein